MATQYQVSASKENTSVQFFIEAGNTKEAIEVAKKEIMDIFDVDDVGNIGVSVSQILPT